MSSRRPNTPDTTAAAARFLFTAEGFSAHHTLQSKAGLKAEKLLRHLHPRVATVRLHVKLEHTHAAARQFLVCATAERTGIDHVAHASDEDALSAIMSAIEKLERVLVAAAGMRKHQRRQTKSAAPDELP